MPNKSTNRTKILIVDDEPLIRDLLSQLLSEHFQCVSVGSAEAALSELGNGEFAVVISDIDIPGESGLELIPKIKAVAPKAVILLASGNLATNYAPKAKAAGAYRFIEKPFALEAVEAAVKDAVEHHRKMKGKKSGRADAEGSVKKSNGHASYSIRRGTSFCGFYAFERGG